VADDVDIEWHGPEIIGIFEGASMAGLELAAEHLLQVSSFLAPHEEGILALSGEVSKDESQNVAAVSYDTVYAVRQHEELTWRHAEGKTAKYLETPMTTERDTMLELIAAALRDAVEG
jgi:hypothetical protein